MVLLFAKSCKIIKKLFGYQLLLKRSNTGSQPFNGKRIALFLRALFCLKMKTCAGGAED